MDKLPAMVAYWDCELRCRFANRAYERWFGVSPEWIVGRHISELLGPLYALNLPHMQAALRGEPQEFERAIPDPAGGAERYSLANYLPDTVDGKVRGFIALVTEVTAIKHVETALRESEERFRLTLDEAPIGMAIVDSAGRFVRVNRALCEVVGYSAEELTGLTFQAITHPDDLDADVTLAGQLARGELPHYRLGKRYLRKDGTVVDIMLNASALRAPDGKLIHFIAQIEDVTEQNRIDREQRFLADVGPLLAATLDYEATLTTIAELTVREIADVCMIDVLQGAQLKRVKVAASDPSKAWACAGLTNIQLDRSRPYLTRSVLETGRPVLLERPGDSEIARYAQSEEHLRYLRGLELKSAVIAPLFARSRVVGALLLVSSSSQRIYGAADLRLAEELGRRAGLSIDNALLYRAAQQATQARDDVMGIVAHDLRNPVASILLQAAAMRRLPPERTVRMQRMLDDIERSAQRMNRLIVDLLDVSRLESGRLSIEPHALRPRDLAETAVADQRHIADASGVELTLELKEGLADVWGDKDRLLQVFENLIGNALKFTGAGGHVTVGAEQRPNDTLFWVRDTGQGISKEDVPHVFDRFWQGRTAQKRQGAGLGLPIVKGLIDAHRGRIWLESAPGQGTTFFFIIPTAIARASELPPTIH